MYIYKISEHLACAIVNGGYSGLDDAGAKQLDNFLSSLPTHYHYKTKKHKIFEPLNYDAQGDYSTCEVTGLFSNCLDFELKYI